METQQIRNKVANIFFGSIIIAGLFMSYGAYMVYANDDMLKKDEIINMTQNHVKEDDNLTNKKPTPRWRLNANGYSQRYVELIGNTRSDRSVELLNAYGFDGVEVYRSLQTIARIYRVYPEVIICIAYADSSLGKYLKTANNYGNVGNTDSGKTQSYTNLEQGFNAIGKTLNNKNLSYIYTIDYLSRYHNKTGMVYATSPENEYNNLYNCLGMIHNKKIADNWNFRR